MKTDNHPSKRISPGELATGMFVTVLENRPFETEHHAESIFGGSVLVTKSEDRSGMGDVLMVLAVDLPYCVVRHKAASKSNEFDRKIDTRRTVLMELSVEYVHALCPHLATQ